VIVLGAGGVAAANLGVFGGSSSDSATSSDAGGSSAKSESRALAPPSPSTPEGASRRGVEQAQALPRVRSSTFATDAGRLVTEGSAGIVAPAPASGASAGDSSDESQDAGGDTATARRPTAELNELSCPGPRITGNAVPNPIVYDGRVAVLVVHPAKDGRQLVEAWDCAGSRKLDSATVTP
jgi:hypothetical protein